MVFKMVSVVLFGIALAMICTNAIGLHMGIDGLFSDDSIDGVSTKFWLINIGIGLMLIAAIVCYLIGWRQMRGQTATE